jgi:hypothetical protein
MSMRYAILLAALVFCAACNDDGDSCNSGTSDIGALCLPRPLAPGIVAAIQVRELCGRGCSENPSCTAVFRDSQVVLDMQQTTCTSQLSAACVILGCQTRVIPCALPALNEGDYTLVVPGGPAQILHVADGGQSSCFLTVLDGGVQ